MNRRGFPWKDALTYGAAGATIIGLLVTLFTLLARGGSSNPSSSASHGQFASGTPSPTITSAIYPGITPTYILPPTVTPVPTDTPDQAPPTATPIAPGTTLYTASWSNGMTGWVNAGTNEWSVNNGQMESAGNACCVVIAPYSLPTQNFAVIARIQMLSCQNGEFGIYARATTNGNVGSEGYAGGWSTKPHFFIATYDSYDSFQPWNDLGNTPYSIDTSWHTFRMEFRGNDISLLVDGNQEAAVRDSTYPSSPEVGLVADNCEINVASYSVVAL